MGEGNLHSFMACFYYFGPLFFVVALLTQWLIVVPLFNGFDTVTAKLLGITDLLTACLFAAATFAYAIWDSIDGLDSYISLFSKLTMIQLTYWAMNLSVMFLLATRLKKAEENTIQKEV
ncbi:hypothetical protein GCM10023149_06790 [Mucilaginibacter gynuensis]|uniref:Uncharacterized protein n=2 Tax=Mucilaginibacter gynuensis TaxID=1302236 RepID=A0ABP8FVA0_9SPHI